MTHTDKELIISRLEQDLLGPMQPDETLLAYPTDVYLTGILYPQRSQVAQEEVDQLQAEGAPDIDSEDVSKDEISLATVKRPASAGLSFVVEPLTGFPGINIHVSAGVYSAEELPGDDADGKNDNSRRFTFRRKVVSVILTDVSLNFPSKDYSEKETGVDGLSLHIRTSPWGRSLLVTVAMINTHEPGEEYEREHYEEICFFQTKITVTTAADTMFCERPIGSSAVDEDTRMAQLIYRDVVEYAVGHTCSADWFEKADQLESVATTWLPQSTVKSMSSDGVTEFSPLSDKGNGPILSTRWLSEKAGDELCVGLKKLPELYGQWLATQEQRIASLPPELQNQAGSHITGAEEVKKRMTSAVELIKENIEVQTAFRLANRAIMLQRQWTTPDDGALIWRPFQLGFILLSLESIADEQHEDRNVADLLWFPTGGGKTEAYLGLIAFTLFLRRLKYGNEGAGVATFMRYTLRLLTVQQFQRAAALICACEAIRLGESVPADIECHLADIPFSLGLWVGQDSTPNKFDVAVNSLKDESAYSTPKQLKYCPKHPGQQLQWNADTVRKEVRSFCPDRNCHWNRNSGGLPVWTVDEDIYRQTPSLVIGTVDKFAQIARNQNTASLFGLNNDYRQPELIIQDELHLISGPLGTMTGLYEVAIDRLCSQGDVRPKIIASTATIRQATSQIRALFNRKTCLFPPPILDATNSGFAVEDKNDPGRRYLGVTTAGRSAKFILQAVAASLMQSTFSPTVSDENRDDFWSLVTYFNSLRELGGALVLMQDDVPHSLIEYAERRDEESRSIHEPMELTSRVSSAEIKEMLDQLNIRWNQQGTCDVLLASNMISVGVDVPRLGMMIVNGQPKGIAEYIQATSRVGRRRGGPGGLVVTLYNNAKSRDRSHYETFRTWHEALYREVEATSVTPFASRARDKGLHAVLVILARHLISGLRTDSNVSDASHFQPELDDLVAYIHNRAVDIDSEEASKVEDKLQDFLERWIYSAGEYKYYWNEFSPKKSLLISAEKAAEIRARTGSYSWRAEPTPNSMRNVEPSTLYKLKEKLS